MKRSVFFLFLLCFSAGAIAQGLFESASQPDNDKVEKALQLSGFVRGSAFGAGETYDFTNTFGEVSLQAKLKKSQFIMNSDIRFRSGFQFNQPISEFEVKEAFAGISNSTFDLILGEKIENWGRTDGFNPTNNITPNNYFFFSANPDDQKVPNFMMKADIRLSPQIDWEIIALPIFRPSVYRYDLFSMGENVSFANSIFPDKTFKNASVATKLNFELTGIGFSASWFHGYDPFYGFDLLSADFSTGNPIITYIPRFYQKNTFGLDFSLPAGTWILRGEGALNLTENAENKMYIPKSYINFVLALEHDFNGFLTIIQYVGTYTFDFTELAVPILSDPTNMMAQFQYANEMIWFESASFNRKIFHQQEAINHAVLVAISKYFAYETVNAELSGYYNFTSEEYLVRPKLSWKIDGALTATAGYSFMKGPEKSVFNYASPIMNGAFLELKASF